MSDYPMLISNKLHSFRNFVQQIYEITSNNPNFKLSFFTRCPKHICFEFKSPVFRFQITGVLKSNRLFSTMDRPTA